MGRGEHSGLFTVHTLRTHFGCVPLIGQFQQTKIRANAPAHAGREASWLACRRGTVRVAPALPSPRGRAALTRRWSAAKSSIRYKKTKRPNNTNVSFLNDVSSPECPARRVFVFTEGRNFHKGELKAQTGAKRGDAAPPRARPPPPPTAPPAAGRRSPGVTRGRNSTALGAGHGIDRRPAAAPRGAAGSGELRVFPTRQHLRSSWAEARGAPREGASPRRGHGATWG